MDNMSHLYACNLKYSDIQGY